MLSFAHFSSTAKGKKAPPVKTNITTDNQWKTSQTRQGEEINWQVISSGGTYSNSTNYALRGTVAQTAVGYSSSTNYGLSHGYWQEIAGGSCCNGDGLRGNVDGIAGGGGEIDVADLTYLVAFLFHGGTAPPCIDEGNVDGFTGAGGPIDVGDLSYLVAYLFQGGSPPPPCPA